MKICVAVGSRADAGLLEMPIRAMQEEFRVEVLNVREPTLPQAFKVAADYIEHANPDLLFVLGDRFEVLGAVLAAHLVRLPIAHLCGGDVTQGSYDDAMRDCISRMATFHLVTSQSAMTRLTGMGLTNIHLVGNPAIDFIIRGDWKKEPRYPFPYEVVSYQAETIDDVVEMEKVFEAITCYPVFIMPNPDRGNERIRKAIQEYTQPHAVFEYLDHGEFLNLLYHCQCFIGNSSSMIYEAPELGIKTKMIGKRQRGRVIPWGDGKASERIVKVLKYAC